jgi:hypothetical protein
MTILLQVIFVVYLRVIVYLQIPPSFKIKLRYSMQYISREFMT